MTIPPTVVDPVPAYTWFPAEAVAIRGIRQRVLTVLGEHAVDEATSGQAAADRELPGIAVHMQKAGTCAMAHLPLIADGVGVGTLGVAWAADRDLPTEMRALLVVVAGCARPWPGARGSAGSWCARPGVSAGR